MKSVVQTLGSLDHVLCFAGIVGCHHAAEMTAEQWRKTLDVNTTGMSDSQKRKKKKGKKGKKRKKKRKTPTNESYLLPSRLLPNRPKSPSTNALPNPSRRNHYAHWLHLRAPGQFSTTPSRLQRLQSRHRRSRQVSRGRVGSGWRASEFHFSGIPRYDFECGRREDSRGEGSVE